MPSDPEDPYRTELRDGRHAVIARPDQVVATAPSEPAAEHLRSMLCEAYRRGYREGRKARS